jgi:hypothetical protein
MKAPRIIIFGTCRKQLQELTAEQAQVNLENSSLDKTILQEAQIYLCPGSRNGSHSPVCALLELHGITLSSIAVLVGSINLRSRS